jgi:hypothetical protein
MDNSFTRRKGGILWAVFLADGFFAKEFFLRTAPVLVLPVEK